MFSEADIAVNVLRREYGVDIVYDTYKDYVADIPTLIRLGYISVKNTYRGGLNFFVKVEVHKLYRVKYDYYNNAENYSVALYCKGEIRPISFGYEFKELIEYLESI